tara:strand:- start:2146 stop:2847 length:702 start_codon:yes stop_codon:yes gene_type:complete
MFVAANFRKEVTSTALWLLGNGISLQCIKVTPYRHDIDLYLNVEQIIPTPEAEELMLRINAKAKDEKETVIKQNNHAKLRISFWEQTIKAFQNSDCRLFDNITPTRDNLLIAATGIGYCSYKLILRQLDAKVEIKFHNSDKQINKAIFDCFYDRKNHLEKEFGAELKWNRLNENKASNIQYVAQFYTADKETWPEIIDWMIKHMTKLEIVFKQPLLEAAEQMKKTLQEPVNTV